MALRCKWYHIWFHAHILLVVHGLHGVWSSLQGWHVGTLGNTVSGCVTQDPAPQEASAIHPTHTNVCVCVDVDTRCVHT